jgi:hypothetical protein
MRQIATLFIVFVIAGGPIGSLACGLSCIDLMIGGHQSATECQHVSRHAPDGEQVSVVGGCHEVVAAVPFLAETRISAAGLAAIADAPVSPRSFMTQGDTPLGLSAFGSPTRTVSLSHTVLRI